MYTLTTFKNCPESSSATNSSRHSHGVRPKFTLIRTNQGTDISTSTGDSSKISLVVISSDVFLCGILVTIYAQEPKRHPIPSHACPQTPAFCSGRTIRTVLANTACQPLPRKELGGGWKLFKITQIFTTFQLCLRPFSEGQKWHFILNSPHTPILSSHTNGRCLAVSSFLCNNSNLNGRIWAPQCFIDIFILRLVRHSTSS